MTDRVGVLEQGHARLAARFDLKAAIDAELDEYLENVRYEDHFLISGLPGPGTGLSTRDWQGAVKKQILEKIQIILGRQAPISYVQNATGTRKDGIKVFLVKMVNVEDARLIRDKFGSSFKAGAAARPPGLEGLSIRNRVTIGTRIRLEIMKLLAFRYKSANPGSKTQVINYEPRPSMKFTPASDASDRRALHFTYIRAVTKLPVDFSSEEINPIYRIAASSSELIGKLRSTFIVLSDDVARELSREQSANASASAASSGSGVVPGVSAQPGGSSRGSRGGRSNRSSSSRSHSRMEHDRSRSRSPLRGPNDS